MMERVNLGSLSLPSGGSISVLLGPSSFWIQMLSMLSVQVLTCMVFAIITYNFVLNKRSSMSSFLLSFGFIIPSAYLIPFYFIEFSGVVNIAVMVGASAIAIMIPFTCIEALSDTSLPGVEDDLTRYVSYYSSIIPLERDKSGAAIPITRKELTKKALTVLIEAICLIFFMSIMEPCKYRLFAMPRQPNSLLPPSPLQLLHWAHLLNNFATACFTSQCLGVGTEAIGVIIAFLTGFKTIQMMKYPMLLSSSPSDFWGNRWNLMVHGYFKRGVFLPLVRNVKLSRSVAMMVTFLASGLIHEYVCLVTSMKYHLYPHLGDPYVPYYGRHLAFFMWNGFVLLLEYLLSPLPLFQWAKTHLPQPVVTALTLLTVLPISHWFTDEYIRSGFLSDYTLGFPLLVYHK
jgi:hypothetical protein